MTMASVPEPDLAVFLLGSVEVRIGGASVTVQASSARVLAILAARPGTVVSVAAIVDGLWGDAAPVRAERTVQTYVSRLRAALSSVGVDPSVVTTVAPGYRLAVTEDRVDL